MATRNVRGYDHVCPVARALERVGERWSLLVVRDLLTGPKRFTDLAKRLGGITAKTLTTRLTELQVMGIVEAEREPGRREVWYRLTEAGEQLRPAVRALSWWGLRNAWRPPRQGDRLHPEHLLSAIVQVLEHADQHGGTDGTGGGAENDANHRAPATWLFRFDDDGDYTIEHDARGWTLTMTPASTKPGGADVEVHASKHALSELVAHATRQRAKELGVELIGDAKRVRELLQALRAFDAVVPTAPVVDVAAPTTASVATASAER